MAKQDQNKATPKEKVLTPYADRVLIAPEEKLLKTAGGIIIPDTVVQKPSCGVVIAVGDECLRVKVGDNVMFGKETGMGMNVNGKDLLLMREGEIFFKYE